MSKATKKENNNFIRFEVFGQKTSKTVRFWIGRQGFTIARDSDIQHARFMLKMIRLAFDKLENKNKEVFEIHRDFLLELRKDVLLNPTMYAKGQVWLSDVNMEIHVINGLILER